MQSYILLIYSPTPHNSSIYTPTTKKTNATIIFLNVTSVFKFLFRNTSKIWFKYSIQSIRSIWSKIFNAYLYYLDTHKPSFFNAYAILLAYSPFPLSTSSIQSIWSTTSIGYIEFSISSIQSTHSKCSIRMVIFW